MVPTIGFGLVAVLVAVFLLRRVFKMLVWLAVAVVIGVGIPGVVLGVLFLFLHGGGVH